jgi:hypothetical protein
MLLAAAEATARLQTHRTLHMLHHSRYQTWHLLLLQYRTLLLLVQGHLSQPPLQLQQHQGLGSLLGIPVHMLLHGMVWDPMTTAAVLLAR